MPELLLGVDAGGTKTDALVVTRDGAVIGRARGGPANHEAMGLEAAFGVLAETALAALRDCDGTLAASAWGLAGLDWPSDEVAYRGLLDRLELPGPRVVVNDAFVALRAGVPQGPGVVVNSGTGAVAAGRSATGATFRTLGLGSGFGDWGSGPDIVREAVHAVAVAFLGLGPATALTDRCLARSGAASVEAYLERVSRERRTHLLPPDVWEVAAAGDEVANGIADRVAGSLAAAAGAVTRRLDLVDGFDLVLSGRVLSPGDQVLHDRLITGLAETLPGARPRRLAVAPVTGAVGLAADAIGWDLPG